MDYYVPGLVYSNLCIMLEKRGGVLQHAKLSEDQIVQQLNQREYVIAAAKREPTDPRGAAIIAVVLVAPDSKISKITGNLKKVLADVLKLKTDIPLEVMLVTKEPMQERLTKQEDLRKNHLDVTIDNYPYLIFMVNITTHDSVPKHILANDDEVDKICVQYHTTRDRFSKLPMSDPQAVWLGLKPGMVVKVIRPSESAGYAPTYKVCTKG